jgi:hypothetical protein
MPLGRAHRSARHIGGLGRSDGKQGMTDEASRFAHRGQINQRKALFHGRKPARYLFSLSLSVLSGYGYQFGRALVAYVVVISAFAAAYRVLVPGYDVAEAIVASVNAFHGRGFQAGSVNAVGSAMDLVGLISAGEAFVGLVIEVVLIATMTQRPFGR